MPKQALLDGTLEDADDLSNYNELTELMRFLTQNGWSIINHTTDRGGYNYFEIKNGSSFFKLHIYLKKIMWRYRSDLEKGVQFAAEHVTTGFDVPQTDTEKTIVLGIYKRSLFTDTIICAWNPFQWGNRGRAFNCFVDVGTLANAYIYGMWRDETKVDRTVFAFRPEFIFYYLFNSESLVVNGIPEVTELTKAVGGETDFNELPRNKIIYGAPGTGKSNKLMRQALEAGFTDDSILRVTFHPNYSYQQFVGSYKPTPIYKSMNEQGAFLYQSDRTSVLTFPFDKEPLIDYTFVEGPLTKQLIKAMKDSEGKPVLLIIEEINRANVAAVFGDIFQLLDRSAAGDSEYAISVSPEFSDFLAVHNINGDELRLPPNLYIWSTMNSADQGVMPLDSAFKRRWTFEYLPLDEMENVVAEEVVIFLGKKYYWNDLRKALNEKLKNISVPEDKLLGPFFMNSKERTSEEAIKNKLLLYLRDDVLRHNPTSLFAFQAFSDIIKSYNSGNQVFIDFEMPQEFTEVNEDGTEIINEGVTN